MSFVEKMAGNTTAGSTLLDEELRRIILEREQECMKLKDANTTLPPGKYHFLIFQNKKGPAITRNEICKNHEIAHASSLYANFIRAPLIYLHPGARSINNDCALMYLIFVWKLDVSLLSRVEEK